MLYARVGVLCLVACACMCVHAWCICDRRGGYLFVCDGFCTSESEGMSVLFCVHCVLQVLAVS